MEIIVELNDKHVHNFLNTKQMIFLLTIAHLEISYKKIPTKRIIDI